MARKPNRNRPKANDLAVKAEPFIKRIEFRQEELAEARAEAAEDIKIIVEDAERAGIQPKALRYILKQRKFERSQAAALEKLDIDERAQADALADAQAAQAFGDSPFGNHLRERAEANGRREGVDPVDAENREDEAFLQKIGRGRPSDEPPGEHAG